MPDNKSKGEAVEVSKHSNKALVVVLIVIGVIVLLGVLGTVFAGAFVKTMFESATGTSIKTNLDGTTTITTKDGGASFSTEQKLTSDFPSSVPLYKGQKIVSSSKVKNDSGSSWYVSGETSDSAAKVVDSLKSSYDGAGWSLDSETETDGAFWLYYKNSQYETNLYVSSDNGTTSIAYTVNPLASM